MLSRDLVPIKARMRQDGVRSASRYGLSMLSEGIQGARRYCVLSRLTFECRSDNITVAPDEATPTHRAETVERNTELGRHDAQTV